jgi:hypothetical protein
LPTVVDVGSWLGGAPHAAEHPVYLHRCLGEWDRQVPWLDEDTVAVQRVESGDAVIDRGRALLGGGR